jgi:hypothetical protein
MTPTTNRRDGEGLAHPEKTSLLGCTWAEVRAALPWLGLGFALGAIVEAARAMWRAM